MMKMMRMIKDDEGAVAFCNVNGLLTQQKSIPCFQWTGISISAHVYQLHPGDPGKPFTS